MTPKKKAAATSSESNSSSTSNSSSSSTSSSSTSGSDSSSSDSDNSSTSRATASKSVRAASTDSETRKSKKKCTSSKAKVVEADKQKESKSKARPLKTAAVYSSESEEPPPPKIGVKRKANAKPKPAATVTVVPKQKAQKAVGNAKSGPTARKTAKETAAQKKLKSIFSPENSSDDDFKLAPMKTVAASKALPKQKAKASVPPVASVSSCAATSSSFYSSDSDDSAFEKPINRKKTPKKKPTPPAPRKLTRSSNARQSKHVMSKASDSESEIDSKQVAKQANASRQNKNNRKAKGRANKAEVPAAERLCPVMGCDSKGHMSGRFETHFTLEACPKYHNKTVQECIEDCAERLKREDERKKAVSALALKPNQLTQEHKNYLAKVKEMRKAAPALSATDSENIDRNRVRSAEEKQRQPNLVGIAPDYDLKLFNEAQAIASEKLEDELKKLPHVKGTKYVEMGKYEMEVWYQSPYPDSFSRTPKLFLCEYCLRYMKSRTILRRHVSKCVWRHPPGEEVYRKEKISVWEVDGRKYKLYSQNLCLLAKFFLDHKTLYYDVEPFLFYVMTIGDSEGCHTVGYFSKEKNSFLNYNVSCILTLPPYQRQGYGRLLIDFSYLLTRVEGKIGSPEKPLSDLGLISYRSYWKDVLLGYLCNNESRQLSIKDISQEMAINSYDIVSTLQALEMLKYWKGKHIILKKPDVLEEYVERTRRRGSVYKEIDPAYLKWTPFVAPAPQGPGV